MAFKSFKLNEDNLIATFVATIAINFDQLNQQIAFRLIKDSFIEFTVKMFVAVKKLVMGREAEVLLASCIDVKGKCNKPIFERN